MRKRIAENFVETKLGNLDVACQRYGLGRNTMRRVAEEAHAIVKFGKSVRVNFTILDAYMDALAE